MGLGSYRQGCLMRKGVSLRPALGFGAAKEGVHHWWMQRLTAIALVPLGIWFAASVVLLEGASYERVTTWIGDPVVAVLLILTLGTLFLHLKLGLQVVIEDYIHTKLTKYSCLVANTFLNIVLGIVCIFSVLKVAL